jgi:3-carboxy-cis,cis-muconate cycloisomerase
MTYSPFDHPYLSGLLGDEEIGAQFSAAADIRGMLDFEAALAQAEAKTGLLTSEEAQRISTVCRSFVPDMARLKDGTARDGVVIPELIRQLRDAIGGDAGKKLHFGATSQDVIDTSLMLRLKTVSEIIVSRLKALSQALSVVDESFGKNTLMGHTRMQAAIPITVSDRIATWAQPLIRHQRRLTTFAGAGFAIQFGGAAGTLEKLGDKGLEIRAEMAKLLDLTDTSQWQSQRDGIVEFAGILAMISGSVGKIGQDIALLAQGGSEISLAGGGGSSAMPHKQNPVAAETLVALARFNAVQISGLQQAMIHEQERSGNAWMLEWMMLPQMVMATGAALRLSLELAGNIRQLGA